MPEMWGNTNLHAPIHATELIKSHVIVCRKGRPAEDEKVMKNGTSILVIREFLERILAVCPTNNWPAPVSCKSC